MTKFGDKTVLHVHVQVTSSFFSTSLNIKSADEISLKLSCVQHPFNRDKCGMFQTNRLLNLVAMTSFDQWDSMS